MVIERKCRVSFIREFCEELSMSFMLYIMGVKRKYRVSFVRKFCEELSVCFMFLRSLVVKLIGFV